MGSKFENPTAISKVFKYDKNETKLGIEEQKMLKDFAESTGMTNMDIYASGDCLGDQYSNLEISMKRAKSVQDHLSTYKTSLCIEGKIERVSCPPQVGYEEDRRVMVVAR